MTPATIAFNANLEAASEELYNASAYDNKTFSRFALVTKL